ncbi:MAG: hypothetical protein JWQ53_776, partial [Klenkia sp.]|nr:hypothetical protein [Klenkia sp.]
MSSRHTALPAAPVPENPAPESPADTADTADTVAAVAAGRHRRPPARRPAVYLAAVAAGAVLVNIALGTGPGTAQADPSAASSQAVSVADQLGLTAAGSTAAPADLGTHLGELESSRAQREADEATAAQAQAAADQAEL